MFIPVAIALQQRMISLSTYFSFDLTASSEISRVFIETSFYHVTANMEVHGLLSVCFLHFILCNFVHSLLVNVHVDVSKPLGKITKNFVGVTMNSTYVKENWKYFNLK